MRKIVFSLSCLIAWNIHADALRVEKVLIGIDGYVRGERWAPVAFIVQNLGSDFRGTIELHKGETIFRKSLHLASGTTKKVEILYYHSSQYENLRFQILNEKKRVVLEDRLEPRVLNYTDNLILVVSTTEYNHQFLNGHTNPWGGKTFSAYLKPEQLPEEWLAYSIADAVAIGSMSSGDVFPAQWRAIVQYAASGGVLILSAATDPSITKHPLLRNNLPEFTPELSRVSDASFLQTEWSKGSRGNFPQLTVPVQLLYPRPCDRELVALDVSSSLVTTSPYWKGNIIYFAFDYTRLPEVIGGVFRNFWNSLIFPGTTSHAPPFAAPFRKRLEDNPRVQKLLYNIPGLRLPNVKWFALFFFVYLCAIGPLQYLALKLLRKNYLLWITFPLIIFIFTISAYAYSKYRQSGERRLTQVAVHEIYPALGYQTTYQVYGIALAESGTFRFQAVPSSSYLRKFALQAFSYQPEEYELSEDLPRELQNESLKNWMFRTFDAMSEAPIDLPIKVTATVRNDELFGEIHNASPFHLSDSFFFCTTKNTAYLGTVPAGSKRSFSLHLNGLTAPPFAELHLRDLMHFYNVSYANPHFFFGQIADTSGEIIINGRKYKTSCNRYVAVYVDIRNATPFNFWTATSF